MKRWLLLIIILLIPIAFAESLISQEKLEKESWNSQEEFNCKVCCIENDKFSIKTTIKNNGTETLWLGNAKLIDKEGKEFAFYKPADPNFRYGLLPRESINLNYDGIWPKPSTENTFFYKQCLYLGAYGKWSCDKEYKGITLAKKIDSECYKDSDCPFDEVCRVNKACTVLNCQKISIAKECGGIERGDWREYECCKNEDCEAKQYCLYNSCENLKCTECEYEENHECVSYECCRDIDCNPDQFCTENECINIKCGYCEYIEGRECKKYGCCEDKDCQENEICEDTLCQEVKCEQGYIEDHQCFKYACTDDSDCREDLICKEGFCEKFGCEEKEIIELHQCKYIGLTPFGYIKDYSYVSYFSKEAFKDNQDAYVAMTMIIIVILLGLSPSITRPIARELKRRRSYIIIKPKH